jgi:hypothetical protein
MLLQHRLAVAEHVRGGAWKSSGKRSPCHSRGYSEFAGILQGKLRQRVPSVRMLMTIFCEGSIRSFLSRLTWQNRHAQFIGGHDGNTGAWQ